MKELVFITSNSAKLAHARYLCREYSVKISKQKNYGIGYIEPRIENREELIRLSLEDAILRFSKVVPSYESKLLFIEDTSVKINALSSEREVPGVDIKYWMRENDFNKIDSLLRSLGNDRNVEVRSDLILVLPSLLHDKYHSNHKVFTSSIKGKITDKEYAIKTQPLYPWLDSNSFNKWFIPEGYDKPLSLLSINDADRSDFRLGAFNQMLTFLHDNKLIKTIAEEALEGEQLELFDPSAFIICGPTCAGKTTIATHLADKYSYFHLEASDFMYLSMYERHGIKTEISIGEFATKALLDNPSIVADQIITNIKKFKEVPVVITGFRSPKEIDSFKKQYAGSYSIQLVYIDAEPKKRFDRSLTRARHDKVLTFAEFEIKDQQQFDMGLLGIKKMAQNNIIYNNDSIETFLSNFDTFYQKQLLNADVSSYSVARSLKTKQLQKEIILSLSKLDDLTLYHTTTEIAHIINSNLPSDIPPKSKNNVSRFFNQNYYPYFEIVLNQDDVASYRLSQTGIAYAKWLSKIS